MADPDSTTGKSPAFQFYPKDFTDGTVDLPTEDVGAYIRLLCYQWGKGAVPSDTSTLARIAGLTRGRMVHVWQRIRRHFTEQGDGTFTNPRLERERQKQALYREQQSRKGKVSAANRTATKGQPESNSGSTVVDARLQPEPQPEPKSAISNLLSPSPDFSQKRAAAVDARSKRPIYTSDRFAVFEWQLDELSKMLGAHYEGFDLHAFFDTLSQQSRASGLVIPRSDSWGWLQAQVLAEAKRRHLPIASSEPVIDRKAELKAKADRVLALIQEEDTARARH